MLVAMYYHIKYCLLMLAISVILLNQCTEINMNDDREAYNQRNMMIEQFKNALMNDSEKPFTLKKAFLFPRPSNNGICLEVRVNVTGRVTDSSGYDPQYFCSAVHEDNSMMCIYDSTKDHELLPPITITLTLANFLQSSTIVQTLATLDPSFYYLMSVFSNRPTSLNDHDYYPQYVYVYYTLFMDINKIELIDLS